MYIVSGCDFLPPCALNTHTHTQTYIGSVVVSVNPYKQIGIYGQDTMDEYRGVNFYELPPHMYVGIYKLGIARYIAYTLYYT